MFIQISPKAVNHFYLCRNGNHRQTLPQLNWQKEQVAEMFDKIAPKYDFLNQLLSLGIHKRWRRKSVQLLIPSNPKIILDVATGTGDFAIEANRILCPTKIIGVDISEGMLAIGREK